MNKDKDGTDMRDKEQMFAWFMALELRFESDPFRP